MFASLVKLVPPLVECHTPPAVESGLTSQTSLALLYTGTIFADVGRPELTVAAKLVPLVLTRPRLSALWFLPLAYYPLGESAWPAGDARKLGLALVVTLVLLLAVVRPPLPERFSASWPWLRSELRPRPR